MEHDIPIPLQTETASQTSDGKPICITENTDYSESLHNLFKEPLSCIDRNQLINLQRQDKSLQSFITLVTDTPDVSSRVSFIIDNNILMRRWRNRTDNDEGHNYVLQIVIPAAMRAQLLELAHAALTSSHLGIDRTRHRLLQHFWWPKLFSDVNDFVKTCDTCQRVGTSRHPDKVPLVEVPVIEQVGYRYAIDLVGPLPTSVKGSYLYINCYGSSKFLSICLSIG